MPVSNSYSIEQLVALNDQIAALVRAGIPLEAGLRELGTDAQGRLQQITSSLSARMSAGASLAEALRAEQPQLPAAYRMVVEAGLRTGRLPLALEAISNYARELVELRRRITVALLYPAIVFALAYLLFAVFLVDLIARFRETYELFRLPMNWPLEALVVMAEWVTRWWWAPPMAIVGLVVWWISTGRADLLNFSGAAAPLAWIPFVARISRYFRFANFADLLALLLEREVPLPEGLRLAAAASSNPRLQDSAEQLAESVECGNAAAQGRRDRFGFPPFMYWVLVHGHHAGGLARLLRHAGAIYRRRAISLSNWFKLVFPIVAALLLGGGVTALYAATLFGPLARFWIDVGHE